MVASDTGFLPLRIAILTISDTRTPENDKSGRFLYESAKKAGHQIATQALCTDNTILIRDQVTHWSQQENIDVIITTGGTGYAPRDVTPEALQPLLTQHIPAFTTLFAQISFAQIGTSCLMSRAFAGWTGNKLLFALPGSTGACRDAWNGILCEQLNSAFEPCNLARIVIERREKTR